MKKLKLTLSIFFLCLAIATCKKDKATPATVTDIDGNVYHTVKIGTQTWMVENLRTTHYNDNTPIENITDNTAWKNSDGPAYSWYNNDITNKTAYGALYNWEAIYTGKLAPKGWHVPSVADWEQLINFMGGPTSTAHKLKEVGVTHWPAPNSTANDVYGFTLLPNGSRGADGVFSLLGFGGYLASSTLFQGSLLTLHVSYDNDDLELPAYVKNCGFGVRCIKD